MDTTSHYFISYFYNDGVPVASTNRYSDVVFYNVEDAKNAGYSQPEYWINKNKDTRGEIELSNKALVFTVVWDPKQETNAGLQIAREVSLGSFTFQGNLLKSASIESSILVYKDGTFKGKKYSSPVSLDDWNLLQVDGLINTKDGESITSLDGYEKYLPDGWYEDPFSKSIVSMEDETSDQDVSNASESNTLENQVINGSSQDDLIYGKAGNNILDGKTGIDTAVYSGKFSDYSFQRSISSLNIADQRTSGNQGTDTLSNIEFIQFTDQTIEESKVDIVKTYSGNFSDYKFYNRNNGVYQIKTDSGYDEITGIPKLIFLDKTNGVSAVADIKGTFDQVTGLDTDSGEMFRLYNAAFARFPDADGLEYWIDQFSSGKNTRRVVAQSFLASDEFTEKYGSNVSDELYVNNLYKNVLGRDADAEGLNYWVGNLKNGIETRYEALLGFAESTENKALFSEMTGFV